MLALGILAGAAAMGVAAWRARDRAEENSRRRREEERKSFMDTLVGGIAHEIRNPLSTLRMNLQLLREDWDNPITEREQKGRKRIDVLLRETERMESVVSDLVHFASGHALRLEKTNLNTLAAELLDFIAPQAEQSRIRLIRDFSRELPLVEADRGLIRQALRNLLINAQQALPTGGEITVRTRENGQHVKLSISDNGPGIPPDHREKIFTLYFSTKPGGMGLGLPLVKKIIEEHLGRIEMETGINQGATFTIWLKK
jgi:signal transduction histidine kinase